MATMYILYHLFANDVMRVLYQKGTLQPGAASTFVKAIMDPTDTFFDRLSCPPIGARYDHLKNPTGTKYFFALDLFNSAAVLPSLLGAVVETMKFVGEQHCTLSIVEGRSTDGTYDIIAGVGHEIRKLGAKFYLDTNDVDPKGDGVDRILALAALRNQALRPLVDERTSYARDTVVIFLNDVVLCADDILELLHQHIVQSADMSCAMDWNDKNNDVLFYDAWVARGISGDTFFEIPQSSEWTFAANLFWNDPLSKQRFEAKQPFQVYACWNGVAIFRAKPIMDKEIEFRRSADGECHMGEPTLFCKDLWRKGYGKIQVVPSVNVAYSVKEGRSAKAVRGWVADAVDENVEAVHDDLVQWQITPPAMVKCAGSWGTPSWVPPL